MTRSSSFVLIAAILTGCASYEVKAPCRRLPDAAVAYDDPCGEMRSVDQRFEDIDFGSLSSVGMGDAADGSE